MSHDQYKQNYDLIDWNARDIVLPERDRLTKARSELPGPMILSDTMPEVEHPCDGKRYSSKSTFRRVTREHGCIEVGNDARRFKRPARPNDDRGIDRAIDKAMSRI